MVGKSPAATNWCLGLIPALLLCGAAQVQAADPENCLLCHRYPGFGRMEDDGTTVRLYHVNPNYYDRALGPHARLRCTDCHPREEVEVIPHQPVSPVDCTSACHLATPGNPPRIFAHEGIAEMLEQSVHTRETLERCNELLGNPLSAHHAHCLLCHDEPTFRRTGEDWFHDTAPTQRCDVCHGEELAVNTRSAFWHVHARSRDARTHLWLARGCALCHSNPAIRREYHLPDSIASYLASFHGKAMQLGSEATAGCLDCHVPELGNIHLVQHHDDPVSPAFEGNLPHTCRSAACHPGGGAMLSQAAVHMELTPTRAAATTPSAGDGASSDASVDGGDGDTAAAGTGNGWDRPLLIEYLVAIAFVLLIMTTFGPSAILQILELLQIVVGRHSAQHHEHVAAARRVKASAAGRQALVRFTPHQRVQHWVLFASFTLLVLTGYPLKFADRGWADWLIHVFGGLSVTRSVHRWAGLVLLVGAVYHLVYVGMYVAREVRRPGRGLWATLLNLPMVCNARDLREFGQLLAYLLFLRKTRPESGRFAIKEKFEYFGVFWGCALLGVTGLIMWENAWATRYVSGRVLTIAALVHTLEAYLALLHVGIFHLIGVIFAPHAFPLSRAMITGETPDEELAELHAGMVRETAARLDIQLEDGS